MPLQSSPQATIHIPVSSLPRSEDLEQPSHFPDFLVTRADNQFSYAITISRDGDDISATKEVRVVNGGAVPHAIPLGEMQIGVRDLVRLRILEKRELEHLGKLAELRKEADLVSDTHVMITTEELEILDALENIRQSAQIAVLNNFSDPARAPKSIEWA